MKHLTLFVLALALCACGIETRPQTETVSVAEKFEAVQSDGRVAYWIRLKDADGPLFPVDKATWDMVEPKGRRYLVQYGPRRKTIDSLAAVSVP